MAKKLAIVIPYFKLDYFEETLHSLMSQTNKDFKVYIGNDASPQDPVHLIANVQNQLDLVYYAYDTNLGSINLAKSWDRILENVEEEWFQILGDDDRIAPDFVEKFYEHLPTFQHKINVVKFSSILLDSHADVIKESYKNYKSGYYDAIDLLNDKIRNVFNLSLSEHVFKKSKFIDTGFKLYPLAWHTDDMLFLEMSDFSEMYLISESSVLVRYFENSISGNRRNLKIKKRASKQFYKELILELINRNKIQSFNITDSIISIKGEDLESKDLWKLIGLNNVGFSKIIKFIKIKLKFYFIEMKVFLYNLLNKSHN